MRAIDWLLGVVVIAGSAGVVLGLGGCGSGGGVEAGPSKEALASPPDLTKMPGFVENQERMKAQKSAKKKKK